MKRTPRSALVLLIAVLSLALSPPSLAQTFPTKPVRLVVPFAAGGPVDALARVLIEKLHVKWGQAVVLDYRPGANAIIGTEMVAKSAPDGYTLILGTQTSHAANASMYSKLPYDPVKDFAPVSLLTTPPLVLLINPSVPANSVKELIGLAKSRPGELNFAGGSSSAQAGGALLNMLAGIKMVHIPYKANAPAMTDLIGGRVQVMFNVLNSSMPQMKAGRVKALAVTGPTRTAAAPDLPTMIEAGVPDYVLVPFFAVFAPASTSKDIIAKISTDLADVVKMSDVRERLISQSMDPIGSTPEELGKFQRAEILKWATIVERANMKAD